MKKITFKTSVLRAPLLVVLAALACFSCGDVLELDPPGKEPEAFWKNEKDAISAANSLYEIESNTTWAGEAYTRGWWSYIQVCDDMITGRERGAQIRNLVPTGTQATVRDLWGFNYKIIKRANDIISNLPGISMNEDLKKRILGEAYFMAAWKYLELAMTYGNDKAGIPIIKPGETNFLQKRSENVAADYAYIEELLENAVKNLPLFSTYSKKDYGRAHRHAANAMLVKTYLYHAQYDQGLYAKVVEVANRIIDKDGRALLPTYDAVFDHANNWGSEYLWSITNSFKRGTEGSSITNAMLENRGWGLHNGWGYYHPTLSLFEAFEEGDLRRDRTILKFGDEFTFLGNTRRYYSANSKTGFQFNKYMKDWEKPADICTGCRYTVGKLNIPFIRYADVLLMKAEALIAQGQNGDAEINLIRQRVGLVPKTNATLEDLKHERRVELAAELSNRHFDLVRWGDATATYAKPDKGRQHTNKLDPDSPFTIIEVSPARNFQPMHNVFMIPLKEINAAGGSLKQNEGY